MATTSRGPHAFHQLGDVFDISSMAPGIQNRKIRGFLSPGESPRWKIRPAEKMQQSWDIPWRQILFRIIHFLVWSWLFGEKSATLFCLFLFCFVCKSQKMSSCGPGPTCWKPLGRKRNGHHGLAAPTVSTHRGLDGNLVSALSALTEYGARAVIWCSSQAIAITLNWINIAIFLVCCCHFSRMRSEGSRFTWGSGGEAVFAKSCVCDRNHLQPSATVRNRPRVRRKALHSGECGWSGPEIVSSWLVAPQLYWRLQRRCQWEWSVSPQL